MMPSAGRARIEVVMPRLRLAGLEIVDRLRKVVSRDDPALLEQLATRGRSCGRHDGEQQANAQDSRRPVT